MGLESQSNPHHSFQLPWLHKDSQRFYDEIYSWGMDRLPPKLMSYDLPERFKDVSNSWKVELKVTPDCPTDRVPLFLVKTSRTNQKRRESIRNFYSIIAAVFKEKKNDIYPADLLPIGKIHLNS